MPGFEHLFHTVQPSLDMSKFLAVLYQLRRDTPDHLLPAMQPAFGLTTGQFAASGISPTMSAYAAGEMAVGSGIAAADPLTAPAPEDATSTAPAASLKWPPLPREGPQYPVFHRYPKYIVDYQIQERGRIAGEEADLLKRRHLLETLNDKSRQLEREERHWKVAQERLLQAEELRQRESQVSIHPQSCVLSTTLCRIRLFFTILLCLWSSLSLFAPPSHSFFLLLFFFFFAS
jgi:hypothetical protein